MKKFIFITLILLNECMHAATENNDAIYDIAYKICLVIAQNKDSLSDTNDQNTINTHHHKSATVFKKIRNGQYLSSEDKKTRWRPFFWKVTQLLHDGHQPVNW